MCGPFSCHQKDNRMNEPPRIGSLFSGAGGLDMAVESVFGGQTVWHSEIDSAASKVLAHHWPETPNIGDITCIDWDVWDAIYPEILVPVDIICGGYPCQPFSGAAANRRKGKHDERYLWPYVAEAIRHIRPRIVVLENVAGHRAVGFDQTLADLAACGMDARWVSVRASDVGAMHQRERLFVIAYAADTNPFRYENTTDSGKTHSRRSHGEPCRRSDFTWGVYEPRIRRWESVTGRPSPDPVEPNRNGRPRLNAAWSEWLMGWPEGWVTDPAIGISRSDQLRIIGNGVVPAQAAAAIRHLVEVALHA